jgi:S-DNA-T family DNA segregation ATPase FtsK/SpoIIIE
MRSPVNSFNESVTPESTIKRPSALALLAWLAALLWIFMAMASYSTHDRAWSTSGQQSHVNNLGSLAGAYFADAVFFVFGRSAYWLLLVAAFGLLRAWSNYLKFDPALPISGRDNRVFDGLRTVASVAGVVAASCALEWARLYQWDAKLPGTTGGLVGQLLGEVSQQLLGFNGAALFWIALGLVAMADTFRFSWPVLAESLGQAIVQWANQQKSKQEIQQDLEIGRQAAMERQSDLIAERSHASETSNDPAFDLGPLVVEPMGIVDRPPLIEPMSKERQQPLFTELSMGNRPSVSLLDPPLVRQETVDKDTLEMTSRLIEKKLKDFGVEVKVVAAAPGPVITRYEIEPATGVKGSQIVGLSKDLARSLSLVSIRVVETIPGKNFMALELPNARRQSIRLSEILDSKAYNDAKSVLTLSLGKDIVGNPVVADLAKMPHVLVAGTTGSGKSVGINAMILSLLYKAEAKDVRLLMIDPKMLEMSVYEGIPHLLAPVVTDMRQAGHALTWCVAEMERRYKLLSKLGVRNLAGYNTKIDTAQSAGGFVYNPFSLTPDDPEPLTRLPHLVVVIDELADLMMVVGKKVEELIARLAQKARAAGIHLILATQRPSVDVITGLIKANIPTRIAFQVSSKIDSRTILDQMGAEALLGMGDMLYMASGTGLPVRVHGAFVSDEEVHRVVEYLKSQGQPDYIDGVLEGGETDDENLDGASEGRGENDPMYDQAVEVVLKNRKASISLVQRHLKIGYNRAARLVEEMQNAGLVSAMGTNGQREILTPNRQE